MATDRTIALRGELTIASAGAQRERLLAALADDADLRLDLAAVEACDSAGVQLLLALRRSQGARGHGLAVAACAAPVTQALATYGVASIDLEPAPTTGTN